MTQRRLGRNDIRHEAKQLVLNHGPIRVIDYGAEYFLTRHGVQVAGIHIGDLAQDDLDAISSEAAYQAERVIRFLGKY